MGKTIFNLIKEYNSGLEGNGPILWHKKLHKNESGDFACVKGICEGCENPVGCKDCYTDKNGGYCLNSGGESVGGFLVVEYKHQKLVDKKVPGAYKSITEAIKELSSKI
jgi:hypothetical protein